MKCYSTYTKLKTFIKEFPDLSSERVGDSG